MANEKRVWENDEIYELYPEGIPRYLKIVSKNLIKIRAAQWEGAGLRWISIRPKDVVEYYHSQAASMSGARTLAGFTTDWRMVDNMAKECLEIFKIINRPALEKAGKKYKMELK